MSGNLKLVRELSGNLKLVRELSGNLKLVRELSGNLKLVRELSGNKPCHGKNWLMLVACSLNISILVQKLHIAKYINIDLVICCIVKSR